MAKSFKVTLKKSIRGCTQKQKDAVRCLGLRKVNSENTVPDNPAMRGQIRAVQHLVDVDVIK